MERQHFSGEGREDLGILGVGKAYVEFEKLKEDESFCSLVCDRGVVSKAEKVGEVFLR